MKCVISNYQVKKLFFAVFLVFSVLSFLFSGSLANAATGMNKTINFQGKLVDNTGLNVADGTYTVVFSLYTVSSGGANIWTETQSVTTTNGIFQVQLGSSTSLPGSVDFNTDNIYLGIKVGSDAEMTPRIQFTAVPYAFNAQRVNGLFVTNGSGNPFSTTTTLQIGDGKTVAINNGLTLAGTDGTTITFQGSDTYVGRGTNDIMTNKTIGSTGLTFSGAATDITSASNEDLTFVPNGSGDLILNSDFDSGVSIGSSANTPAPLSVSGGIGSNASLIVNNTNSGDLIAASQGGSTKFRVANNGDVVLTAGINAGGTLGSTTQCLTGGAAVAWSACSGLGTNYWQVNNGAIAPSIASLDLLVGGVTSGSAVFKVSPNTTSITASVSANSTQAALAVNNNGSGDLFTASSSGLGRFVIKQNGSVGIGTTAPIATFDLRGIGSYATYVASFSGTTGKSILTVDNNGAGDLFTASKSGATKFVINNAGTVITGSGVYNAIPGSAKILAVDAGDARTGAVVANAGTFLRNTGTYGGVFAYDYSGIGIPQNLLLNEAGGKVGIGSTFTPLGILDVRGNNATSPIASFSGTVNNNAGFVVDNTGTGDIFAASKSGATKFVISNSGVLGLDTSNYSSCDSLTTDTNGLLNCGVPGSGGGGDTLLAVYAISAPSGANLTVNFNGAADSAVASNAGTLTFPSNVSKMMVEVKAGGGGAGGTGTGSFTKTTGGGGEGGYSRKYLSSIASNYYIKVGGGGSGGGSGANGFQGTDSCLGTNSTDACIGSLAKATGGAGSATNNATVVAAGASGGSGTAGDLLVTGAPGGNSSAATTGTFSGYGGGTGGGKSLIAAACGTAGNAGASGGGGGGAFCSTNATFSPGGNGGNGYVLIYLYKNSSGTDSPWTQFNSGVLAPSNLTSDVLIGGNATTSAKFGFLNVSNGTPTASLSAGVAGGAFLTATGVLQTTANQSLTLGGSSTGNVIINPQGVNFVGIGTTAPTTFLDVAGSASVSGSLTFRSGAASIQSTGNNTLTIGGNTTGNVLINPQGLNFVGIGTNAPLAPLDIRTALNTGPTASISGNSTYASLVVNNKGTGDIFAASSSGASRFVIKQNGAVGIGTDLPQANKLEIAANFIPTADLVDIGNIATQEPTADGINAMQLSWFAKPASGNVSSAQRVNVTNNNTGAGGQVQGMRIIATGAGSNRASDTDGLYIDGLANASFATSGQNAIEVGANWDNTLFGQGDLRINANGNIVFATSSAVTKIGIGTTTPQATLDVRAKSATLPVASFSGNTNFAGMIVNNSGNGDIFTASSGGQNRFVVKQNGNVNIGTQSAALAPWKLYVSDYQKATASAVIENTANNNTACSNVATGLATVNCHTGLIVKMGTPGISQNPVLSDHFISFLDGAGKRRGQISGNSAGNALTYATNGADYAEYFTVDPSVLPANYTVSERDAIFTIGTLVCQGHQGVVPCVAGDKFPIVGIISNSYGYLGGEEGLDKVSVALVGQLPVIASNANGAIASGDPIGMSSVPGVAVKAVSAGQIVGRALSAFTPATATQSGSVTVLVQPGWFSPGLAIETDPMLQPRNSMTTALVSTTASTAGAMVLQLNTIMPASGKDVTIDLPQDGGLIIKNASSAAGITFKGNGDAYFAGTISVDMIRAKEIELPAAAWKQALKDGGVETLEARVSNQEARITNLETLFASVSGTVSPTPVASDAAYESLLAHIPNDDVPAPVEDKSVLRIAADGLASVSGKLVVDSVHVTGSTLIEGMLHVVDFLTARNLIVDQLATFLGNVVFKGDVLFQGHPTYSSDTAGYAVIKKGSDHVDVHFAKDYDVVPLIQATVSVDQLSPTPNEDIENLVRRQNALEQQVLGSNARYVVVKRTTKGFTILLANPAEEDMSFSWMAIAVDKPVTQGGNEENVQPITSIYTPSIMPSSIPLPTKIDESDPLSHKATAGKEGGE